MILFSADSSLADRFGALGMIALNFAPGGKLGEAGKLGKLAKLADEVADAGKVAKRGAKTLEEQAAELVKLNAAKHRVTLRTERYQFDYDLVGKKHGGISTPHVKVSPRNYEAPEQFQPVYNTSPKSSYIRPANQQDIRTVRRYLERLNQ